MKEILDKKLQKRIIEIIREKLPKNSKILLLSLTGSRAFGWAGENYDYDIHGLFFAKKFFWYCHTGEEGFDINLYDFLHFMEYYFQDYQSFEEFMNLSNPFFIHKKFDFKGFLKLCNLKMVKAISGDIERQIREFEATKNPRAGLHAYRILMVPIHFLKKRKIELNIFEINKKFYNFSQLEKLKQSYLKGTQEFDFEKAMKDLKKLKKEYDKLTKREEEFNLEKAKKWFEKQKTILLK